jgi:hypothetical protein
MCSAICDSNRTAGPPGREPGLVDGSAQELIPDQFAQVGALPRRAAQNGVDPRERLNAPGEGGHELGRVFGSAQRVLRDRLNAGERVLDAMIKLAHQQLLGLLGLLAFGDVQGEARIAQELAIRTQARLSHRPHPSVFPVMAAEAELHIEQCSRFQRTPICIDVVLAIFRVDELLPAVTAHVLGIDAEKIQVSAIDVLATMRPIDPDQRRRAVGERAEALLGLGDGQTRLHLFRDVPEIADHAEAPIGQEDAIQLPLVVFGDPAIDAEYGVLRNDIRFAGFEGVAEDADDLIRARLVQQNPDDLVEVATDDSSRNVAEHRQSDGVDFANAEVRIHQVHAQRRLVEEHLELRSAMAQRLRGLAAYAGDLDVRRDVSQQFAGAERLDQVVVGSRRQPFHLGFFAARALKAE